MVEGGGKTGSLTGHDQEDVPEKEMGEVVPKRKRPDLSLQPVAGLALGLDGRLQWSE